MPADDLVRLVALQVRGPGVPREHVSLRVQSEDRVVADGGDEQAIQLGRLVGARRRRRAGRTVGIARGTHDVSELRRRALRDDSGLLIIERTGGYGSADPRMIESP